MPSQPSRHRWHLSLVKESALLFYKTFVEKMTELLPLPLILSKFGIATMKTHKKVTKIDFFLDKFDVIQLWI